MKKNFLATLDTNMTKWFNEFGHKEEYNIFENEEAVEDVVENFLDSEYSIFDPDGDDRANELYDYMYQHFEEKMYVYWGKKHKISSNQHKSEPTHIAVKLEVKRKRVYIKDEYLGTFDNCVTWITKNRDEMHPDYCKILQI